MQNHQHLIILNQKINTNTKSHILVTQINYNTNATIVNLSHKKNHKNTCVALIDNYEKVSFVLVMHALLNQAAFFISSR